MISFHEQEADEKFLALKERFPDIKHVKNVKGIGAAHITAQIAESDMVWIVDADTDVLDSFKFDYSYH